MLYLSVLLSECPQLQLHVVAGQERVHPAREKGRVPTHTPTHINNWPENIMINTYHTGSFLILLKTGLLDGFSAHGFPVGLVAKIKPTSWHRIGWLGIGVKVGVVKHASYCSIWVSGRWEGLPSLSVGVKVWLDVSLSCNALPECDTGFSAFFWLCPQCHDPRVSLTFRLCTYDHVCIETKPQQQTTQQ